MNKTSSAAKSTMTDVKGVRLVMTGKNNSKQQFARGSRIEQNNKRLGRLKF